jgi:hypothetical protein
MSMRWFSACACAGALVIQAVTAAAADLVVTQSSIPGITPGMVVDGKQPINIRAGAKLSLVSSNGKVINLVGPYNGVPDPAQGPADDKLVTALSALMTNDAGNSAQIGAVRDTSARARPPLDIDITVSGTQCVLANKAPGLWQPGGEQIESLWIATKTGAAIVVAWPKGEARQPWPAALPLTDQMHYQLLRQPAKAEAEVIIRVIPGNLPSDAHRAAAMAEAGCTAQALALLAQAK